MTKAISWKHTRMEENKSINSKNGNLFVDRPTLKYFLFPLWTHNKNLYIYIYIYIYIYNVSLSLNSCCLFFYCLLVLYIIYFNITPFILFQSPWNLICNNFHQHFITTSALIIHYNFHITLFTDAWKSPAYSKYDAERSMYKMYKIKEKNKI